MTNVKNINSEIIEISAELEYADAQETFLKLYTPNNYNFLFESKDVAPIYGRLSIAGVDPCIRISGKDEKVTIQLLNNRGEYFFDIIKKLEIPYVENIDVQNDSLIITILRATEMCEESKRSKQQNITQVIRSILEKFHVKEKCFLGLYGPFSYDFVRLFEDIGDKNPKNDVYDFDLFLYDTFIYFDHLKERSEIITYHTDEELGKKHIKNLEKQLQEKAKEINPFQVDNHSLNMTKKEFEELVNIAVSYAKQGELFEVVLSQALKADFQGDPFSLYQKYSEINPSPYMFFFNYGDGQVVGASPEMMVRVENNIVHTRPISGTAKRGADPIEDHDNMIDLLSSEKERAELDMLVDLGRNDMARIAKPGIKVTDYRYVEKYSRVMHTVAHLTRELDDGFIALDAFIACINAGTLTGAPKVAAMKVIEEYEKERRGFYGGNIGYLTFSGDMDTCIMIRTAHIKDSKLKFQSGATLLYDSEPEKEYQETLHKAAAFLDTCDITVK